MAKQKGVQETSKERALADVGKAQMEDFKQRWQPVQQKFAAGVVAANDPNSFERRRAATMSGVDTSVRFGAAANKLDAAAAASGAYGSAAHKLGITGMAADRATSAGLGAVAADQTGDESYVAGLNAVTALGRGEKTNAIAGMTQAAQESGRQAAADASASLEDRAGAYQLAGTAAGIGAGLWGNRADPALAAANRSEDPLLALSRAKGWT